MRILRNSTKNARAFKKLFCSLKTKRQYNDVLERTPLLTTPPHLWRKFVVNYRLGSLERNTSIYMEKISKNIFLGQGQQKHLHVRGENPKSERTSAGKSETPPHTWRKCRDSFTCEDPHGNTSTYVEKIRYRIPLRHRARKHLHIRGENIAASRRFARNKETPPHTWRKFAFWCDFSGCSGNTSTYVEKMSPKASTVVLLEKHLHIRGENQQSKISRPLEEETPPHTWRK